MPPPSIVVGSDSHRRRGAPESATRRLRVRFGRLRLDRDLAEGCSPERSVLHAVRARQLADPLERGKVATSLRHVVEDSMQPYAVLTPVRLGRSMVLVSLRQAEVRAWREGLMTVVQRLADGAPANPCGVARARVLLTDGAGPLYNPDPQRRLGEAIAWIADGLTRCPPHRWVPRVIAPFAPDQADWTCERCGAADTSAEPSVEPA
jgi:hypothetical protein